jgi:diguanylate cyclase (GGDEF)-like protein
MERTQPGQSEPSPDKGPMLTPDLITPANSDKLHVFRNVALESIWGLLEHCQLRLLMLDEPLMEKNQDNRHLYVVLQGELKVFLDAEFIQAVATLSAGQTVGELSVIDGSITSAYVKALEPSIVLRIDQDTFWRMVRASHEFCANIMVMLSARMRSNNYSLVEGNRLQGKYQREAITDGLTGINNRAWLNKKLPSLVSRAERDHHPLSLFMLDVDHFKRFNDRYGHAAGDTVLKFVAQVLSSNVRPLDMTARYGGEEFCVILPYTNSSGARLAAERLLKVLAETTMPEEGGESLPNITVSIGVASSQEGEHWETLIKRADDALYMAKKNGRNRIEMAEGGNPAQGPVHREPWESRSSMCRGC